MCACAFLYWRKQTEGVAMAADITNNQAEKSSFGVRATFRGASGPGALAAMAGALALFGGIELWGMAFPILELPLSTEKLADALLQLARGLQDLMPFLADRLDGMVTLLDRLSSGDLAWMVLGVVAVHAVLTLLAIVFGLLAVRRGSGALALVASFAAIGDVAAAWGACAYANQQLYLGLHSLAQGNPWAVGEGVAGLPAEFAPTMGMFAALALAAIAFILAIRVIVRKHHSDTVDVA